MSAAGPGDVAGAVSADWDADGGVAGRAGPASGRAPSWRYRPWWGRPWCRRLKGVAADRRKTGVRARRPSVAARWWAWDP